MSISVYFQEYPCIYRRTPTYVVNLIGWELFMILLIRQYSFIPILNDFNKFLTTTGDLKTPVV